MIAPMYCAFLDYFTEQLSALEAATGWHLPVTATDTIREMLLCELCQHEAALIPSLDKIARARYWEYNHSDDGVNAMTALTTPPRRTAPNDGMHFFGFPKPTNGNAKYLELFTTTRNTSDSEDIRAFPYWQFAFEAQRSVLSAAELVLYDRLSRRDTEICVCSPWQLRITLEHLLADSESSPS